MHFYALFITLMSVAAANPIISGRVMDQLSRYLLEEHDNVFNLSTSSHVTPNNEENRPLSKIEERHPIDYMRKEEVPGWTGPPTPAGRQLMSTQADKLSQIFWSEARTYVDPLSQTEPEWIITPSVPIKPTAGVIWGEKIHYSTESVPIEVKDPLMSVLLWGVKPPSGLPPPVFTTVIGS